MHDYLTSWYISLPIFIRVECILPDEESSTIQLDNEKSPIVF